MKSLVALALCIGLASVAYSQNWPSFRGRNGAGVRDGKALPIAWQSKQIRPHIVTPIVYGDYLYACTDNGILSQYQAKTGEPTFRARLGSGVRHAILHIDLTPG